MAAATRGAMSSGSTGRAAAPVLLGRQFRQGGEERLVALGVEGAAVDHHAVGLVGEAKGDEAAGLGGILAEGQQAGEGFGDVGCGRRGELFLHGGEQAGDEVFGGVVHGWV